MIAALETIEFEAQADLYAAAPEDVRAAHAIAVRGVGGALCATSLGLEPAAIFRRVLGLGVERPATEAELDEVIACMGALGPRFVVPVAPGYRPDSLPAWLEKRGFTKGYAWMKFSRPCEPLPKASTDLDIRVVGADLGSLFGKVVHEGFGLPPVVGQWVARLPGREHWACTMAFDGATPVGAGAVFVKGEFAWLGFGATLSSHRKRGAQNALLAHRIEEAAARGARVAVTETGERQADKPSNSYRNILRAGFEEKYLRQNYLSPPIGARQQ
jgi:GNAT superfamily N-acetyltransferase